MKDDYYDEDAPKSKVKKAPVRTVKSSKAMPKKTERKDKVVKNAKVGARGR